MHVFGLSNMILQTYFSAQTYSRRELINNFMRLYCSKVRLLLNHNFQHHKAQTNLNNSNKFKIIPIIWSSQAHLYETQRERNCEENKAIENISLTLHSINQAGKLNPSYKMEKREELTIFLATKFNGEFLLPIPAEISRLVCTVLYVPNNQQAAASKGMSQETKIDLHKIP
ncbi:Hypothetical_protein [Hexamita inflata]|uniref:Hypothetical_protein n=1 Tax=Hexamita inflata TaxID=28002 RepID=A0ABP1K233_9EUKA